MKAHYALILILFLSLGSCMFSRPESVQNMAKDFNLSWQSSPENRKIFVNLDHTEYGGIDVIDKTVFAAGWSDDFIIALQDPNSKNSPETQAEQLEGFHPRDTVFHIVDIREYHVYYWSVKENVFSFDSREEYEAKRKELQVPSELDFTITGLD